MAKKTIDQYANVAALQVTESAAGTLTTAKFAFPFSIMDKMAILVSRIEYWPGGLDQLNSTGDYILGGITVAASVTDLRTQSDPQVVDSFSYGRIDLGTAATGMFKAMPWVKDLSNLPGGGILLAPNPLYVAVKSNGAGGPTSLWVRLYYTYMELSTEEYWQLVESRRIISS